MILGAEARGFIFGGALAYALGCGFVPARKPGKLPWKTVEATLRARVRHGHARGARRRDRAGDRVIVLDDVLATGGTARAKIDLVEQLGGVVVGALFVIELSFLDGRERLAGYDVHALIAYYERCALRPHGDGLHRGPPVLPSDAVCDPFPPGRDHQRAGVSR